MSDDVLFPTSVIGSLPRPQFVKDLIADDCPIDGDEYRRLMGDAIRAAVALQETAGLDVVTDGEWWRKSYIGVIAELAHGFELSRNPADGRPWTVVVDKLSPKQPGFIAQEITFLKQLTEPQTQGHGAGAGPAGRADVGSREIGEGVSQARRLRSRLRADPAPRSRTAARRRRLDHPGRRSAPVPVRRSRRSAANTTIAERASDFAVDMDNQVVDGIEGVKLAVHLCRRAGARARGEADHRGGYDPILKQLGRLKVDHITMEFTSPGAGDMSVFKQLPEHVEIGLGCVSCQPGQIDSADTIVERVEMALKHVAPQRITLNPDCGFAPGSAADVSLDEVYTKLKNEVAAAQRVARQTWVIESAIRRAGYLLRNLIRTGSRSDSCSAPVMNGASSVAMPSTSV